MGGVDLGGLLDKTEGELVGILAEGGPGGEGPEVRAAKAGLVNRGGTPGWGNMGGPGGLAPIIMMALAFSAAAAAAMRLLFSASLNRGDRKRKEGSIPGGIAPYPSL